MNTSHTCGSTTARQARTRLENIGFGSTVFAMAVAVAADIGIPALTGMGTQLAEWKASWMTMAVVAAHAMRIIV